MLEEFYTFIWNDTTQLVLGMWIIFAAFPLMFLNVLKALASLLEKDWIGFFTNTALVFVTFILAIVTYFAILTILYFFGNILVFLSVLFVLSIFGEIMNPFPNKQNNK